VSSLTLKVTFSRLILAAERRLRYLWLNRIQNLPIRNVAHLKVLLLYQALLVTHPILAFWCECIACIICLANIAVYTTPAIFTIARWLIWLAQWSIFWFLCERAAERFYTIFTTISRRTYTFAIILVALSELVAVEVAEVAIEARRTF